MKTEQAFNIVINMAKKQLKDCPNCGKSQWKELDMVKSDTYPCGTQKEGSALAEAKASQKTIRDVWGDHYREAIDLVEDYKRDLIRDE